MALFDFLKFSQSKPTEPKRLNLAHQEFSTPFLTVGDGNLSMPYIDRYYTQSNVVRFGQDNLYPQLLNQMYYTSAIHGTCIDFITNAIIGGGWEWADDSLTAADRIDLLAFEKRNRFSKLAKILTRDWTMHRRVTVLVCQSKAGVKLKRLDPASIRSSVNHTEFVYSDDWSRGMVQSKTFKRWTPGCTEPESIYVFHDSTPGQDIYPLPAYNSILNFAFLDGEQAFFHKNHIQNSIFPSLAIRRPKEFGSIEEVQKFKQEIQSKQGAKNAGSVLVLTGNGMDDVPEVITIDVKANDTIFDSTSKEIKDNICIAHGINPAIMGIKVGGQLGATTELQDSYAIFEKNRVMPERADIEEILNDLVEACGLTNTVVIKNFQIIDRVVVEK
jgi:hypothetical protein